MAELPEPIVLLPGDPPGTWLRLCGLRRCLVASSPAEVCAVLREAEEEAAAGRIAAGFVTYEAAPAFDVALAAKPHGSLPPAWFAVFEGSETYRADPGTAPSLPWQAMLTRAKHADAVAAIHEAIARGETYQVNYTFPFQAPYSGEALPLFLRLAATQRGGLGAFIETPDFAICSASPELFFTLEGDRISCRPMKGTAARGRWPAEDELNAAELFASEKNRAENLMIVDMVRNDLGRVAATGTVQTRSLFDIERYPNVHQMTSTVTATTPASLVEIFRALFPSASVTGAPKVQTSHLIASLETTPRGVYTGAIGRIGPGRSARFNVAIRTVQIDKRNATATFGTGSGIVWDSEAGSEYDECLAKASVLAAEPWPEFQTLETIRWDNSKGWNFLDEHLARLSASARYFGFAADPAAIRAALDTAVAGSKQSQRVRLTVDAAGTPEVRAEPWPQAALFDDRPPAAPPFVRAAVVADAVHSRDVFLFHKTTHRKVYDAARARCPTAEEILLVNERGELTEGTIGNIVMVFGDDWVTPPLDCGLLPGIFRAHLLRRGALREAVVSPHDMQRADAAYLVNSVRGWRRLAMRG